MFNNPNSHNTHNFVLGIFPKIRNEERNVIIQNILQEYDVNQNQNFNNNINNYNNNYNNNNNINFNLQDYWPDSDFTPILCPPNVPYSKIINNLGKPELNGIFFSHILPNKMDIDNIKKFVAKNKFTLIDGPCINLKNLKFNYREKYVGECCIETFLFLLAIETRKSNIDIEYIDLSQNKINKTEIIKILDKKVHFPNLQIVNISQNYITSARNNIHVNNITLDFDGKIPKPGLKRNKRVLPLKIDDKMIIDPKPELELSMFTPIQIDVNAFPVNPFIVAFFECAHWNINEICQFYLYDNSILTIHIENTNDKWLKDLKNRLSEYESNNKYIFKNQNEIGKAYLIAFQNGFFSYPLAINGKILPTSSDSIGLCAFIVHGVFQVADGQVYGFDHSLIIASNGSNTCITNDNFYIREVYTM